ncbi:hypothetical protein VOLCADRAFT_98293 [Volvox carteri f. nagariensis]|uniref:Fungal lipase-type domain-containing protein n=1 Tax=Volvox carteri f. nagariensis TaxID=3068 RepID=D8UEU5_VOLCA|nr:uncharacterized protein VOLCADRAFT_98293 [Volvox carteri f. nagariensis]EFJ41746.1 hypothetical protein VOLCADRAFT_98293 [Volvox carteri f. nagariensis]|eukprot:XP_002957248.1 hypothetical protein VOLCADRAFT_98293 [Volvox carteri f. nagariensis]
MAQVLREASTKERELQNAKAPLDVSAFLSPVGVWELKHIRKLAHLTSLTYYMHLVTPRRLMRSHRLELVTTSHACEIRPYEHNKTAEEVGADGDGMAVSVHEAREVYQALKRDGGASAAAGALTETGLRGTGAAGSSNIVTLPGVVAYQVVSVPQAATTAAQLPTNGSGPARPMPPLLSAPAAGPGQVSTAGPQQPSQPPPPLGPPTALPRMLRTPAEVVAAKLAEAAQAATTAASPLASAAAESLYAGLASLPIGSALVGANNRASNALLSSATPPSSGSTAFGAATSSPDGGITAAPLAVDGAGGYEGRKATAASIAALASDQFRQQTIRGMMGFGAGRSGGGSSGMAPVTANGLLTPATATAAATAPADAATAAVTTTPSSSSSSPVPLNSAPFACPSEWFVVDEPATNTRIFVIQGSDTLDHWKLNLTFDPVTFEDPSLGVKVHRGVYEAALVLYDRFLPLVYEHLESSPFSKIAFTGHSIGGSLATLLMIMYRHRGVLPPHSIGTVYTFGAPAVFCQTHSHSHAQAQASNQSNVHNYRAGNGNGSSGSGSSAGGGAALSAVSSAPCPPSGSNSWVSPSLWSGGSIASGGSISSTSSVEDPLFAVPPSTTSAASSSLSSSSGGDVVAANGGGGTAGCACGADLLLARLHLPPTIVRNIIMARDIVPRAFACDYSPVADILKGWGSSFKEHCCLNRHGRKHLYYFVGRMCILQPDSWHSFTANDPDHPMLPPGPELFALTDSRPHAAEPAAAAAAVPAAAARPAARNVTEAIWELMDCPHPLETLGDPGAYLASGSISRYHNPENYTKALGRITHLKRRAERRPERKLARVAMAAATKAPEAKVEVGSVPWDSSDGLDQDLHVVAPALLTEDVHACR